MPELTTFEWIMVIAAWGAVALLFKILDTIRESADRTRSFQHDLEIDVRAVREVLRVVEVAAEQKVEEGRRRRQGIPF